MKKLKPTVCVGMALRSIVASSGTFVTRCALLFGSTPLGRLMRPSLKATMRWMLALPSRNDRIAARAPTATRPDAARRAQRLCLTWHCVGSRSLVLVVRPWYMCKIVKGSALENRKNKCFLATPHLFLWIVSICLVGF